MDCIGITSGTGAAAACPWATVPQSRAVVAISVYPRMRMAVTLSAA